MREYDQLKATIQGDMGSSFWIQEAVNRLERRDPIDALCDVEVLLRLCKLRVDNL